ncbi:helix-turn-helix domain-containing protein [Streptomyces graminilatus]|uniref:helix-turn-helix domain-containing protein n=1 Tax=Streptomyces graminilatus TaxID=1464070 RepID=UPI0006E133C1|nr:helix-turn-helix transcriptional regulator [Streptomyces graminilatus]
MVEQTPTVRRRRLGSELRKLREGAGVGLEQAAETLECSRSKISRIELGYLGIRVRDVRDLLASYGVKDDELLERLTALARDGSKRGWWDAYGQIIPPAYANYLGLEADAGYIRTFQSILIPGLLQTEEYSRAVMKANPAMVRDEVVDTLMKVRAERQVILTRDQDPVRFWAIIGEAALRTPVGSPAIMQAQLDHLAKMTERPNITLQVLPYSVGAHAGLSGPFLVLSFAVPNDSGVVWLENLSSSLYLDTQEEVAGYTLVFDDLRSSALNPAGSLERIARIAHELGTKGN